MDSSGIVVIGSYFSPYVRKVLVALGLKGVDYQIDPISPFFGNDEFTRLNPSRKIPVLKSGTRVICGSADICAWLETEYTQPPLLGVAGRQDEQVLEWQNYADDCLGKLFVHGLVHEAIVKPFFFGKVRDDQRVRELVFSSIPAELDQLETRVPDSGYLLGSLTLADIAVASMFRTAQLVRFSVDVSRWPRTGQFLQRLWSLSAFATLRPMEDICAATPYAQHRTALAAIGAPLTSDSLDSSTPRPSPQPGATEYESVL